MTTNLRPLRDYQDRTNQSVESFLLDSTKIRGQIYSPTGSGKTECFSHTIHDLPRILNAADDLKVAIIHPRIALSQEQLGRFKQTFGTRFHYTSFHSGAHISAGATFSYRYFDMNGIEVTTVDINSAVCAT